MKSQSIKLNNIEVQYRIIPKNNKNTYFRFKKNGTIEITKSKYQSKRDIISYMKNNASTFLRKLEQATIVSSPVKEGYYHLFDLELKIEYVSSLTVDVNLEAKTIQLPHYDIENADALIHKTEREIIKQEAKRLMIKYKENPYVDINDITIRVRHTKTRFGSCNATKRNINLNANLVHYKKEYLEYVFLHEIAHLKHQNHSKEYYLLLEKLCPNYRQIRKELREIYR